MLRFVLEFLFVICIMWIIIGALKAGGRLQRFKDRFKRKPKDWS